jgi:hypothetical protein
MITYRLRTLAEMTVFERDMQYHFGPGSRFLTLYSQPSHGTSRAKRYSMPNKFWRNPKTLSADHPITSALVGSGNSPAPPANDHPGAIRPPPIHDLRSEFILRESKIRQDYLDRVNQITSEAE